MPAERLGPAGFDRRHHPELGEADMPGIGPPPCGTMGAKDVSDFKPRAGHRPGPLIPASILQLGQRLVGARRVTDQLRGDMCVAFRCLEFGMPEQYLDHPHIRPGLQKVRREAMPQRVQRAARLLDPRDELCRAEGAVELARREGVDLGLARKQPALGPRLAPVLAQQVQQSRRQHDLPVLPPLTLFDMDQHPVAVDIADLEIADFRCPEPGPIGNAERRPVLQPRSRRDPQQRRYFLGAEHYGELARLGAELHVPLHLAPPAGRLEEEPQCDDAGVAGRRRDTAVGHVKLVGAQIIRRRGVRRPSQKRCEVLDCPDVRLLRFVTQSLDPHVLDHPRAQRRCSLLCHGSLLSFD